MEIKKLDGVGPVDNIPSTNCLHYFDQFLLRILFIIKKMFKKNIFTCDRWHMTDDRWHMTHDT